MGDGRSWVEIQNSPFSETRIERSVLWPSIVISSSFPAPISLCCFDPNPLDVIEFFSCCFHHRMMITPRTPHHTRTEQSTRLSSFCFPYPPVHSSSETRGWDCPFLAETRFVDTRLPFPGVPSPIVPRTRHVEPRYATSVIRGWTDTRASCSTKISLRVAL